jgi:hypothetical protein
MPRKPKEKNKLQTFLDYFSNINDPRIQRNKLFPLDEILLVVLCGTICGAEGWEDFQMFGEEKFDFLKTYLPFKNGSLQCKLTKELSLNKPQSSLYIKTFILSRTVCPISHFLEKYTKFIQLVFNSFDKSFNSKQKVVTSGHG